MRALNVAVATVVALAVLAALAVGGWEAGWWFRVHSARRQGQVINIQAHNYRQGYAFQQILRDQITQNIATVLSIGPQVAEAPDAATRAALRAQREAVVQVVCQDAAQVSGDPIPADQEQFVQVNCEAGVVSPGSPYSGGVNP